MKLRWLAGALVVQSLAFAAIVNTWWPEGPSEENLGLLSSQYDVTDAGSPKCGDGATAFCGWTFVVSHGSSDAELARELDRIGIDEYKIENIAPDQTQVDVFWVESGPGPRSFFVALFLFLGICMTLLASLSLLVRRSARRLTAARARRQTQTTGR